MGRKVEVDIDRWINRFKVLSEEGPGLLQVAAAMFPSAANITPYAGLIAPLAAIAEKMAAVDAEDGGLRANIDIGKLGRGRMSYIKTKSTYSDEDVVWACSEATSAGNPACRRVEETIAFTMRCMFPGSIGGTAAQRRAAIDQVLEADGMSEGMCDRLGDMIYYCLRNKPTKTEEDPSQNKE